MTAAAPNVSVNDPHMGLAERLKYCRQLPTLPAVALRLIDLAEDPSATLEHFTALVSMDPALAGKLMRVANSSFYGLPREVTDLPQAVNLLGFNGAISLAMSFSLHKSAAAHDSDSFDAVTYWRRSLLTALAARTIAVELDELQPDDFLLAGLLQDIGVLAMEAMFGSAYANLYSTTTSHQDLLQHEITSFGFTHINAGTSLLRQWKVPDRLADSVRLSHELAILPLNRPVDMGRLPIVVAAAEYIADAWVAGATVDAFLNARASVEAWLELKPEQFQRILSAMATQMPDVETMFETRLADPAEIANIESVAREILTTRHLRSLQRLKRRAVTLEGETRRDAMTGLYNRAYFDLVFTREFARSSRNRLPLSLIFLDIDHFKALNDTHGHAAGDRVLTTVARRLLSNTRRGDIVARYGGEEFVILLMNTPDARARIMAERITAAIHDAPFRTRGASDEIVTLSAGIATHMDGKRRYISEVSLLEAADRALYTAKGAGRGEVVVAESRTPDGLTG